MTISLMTRLCAAGVMTVAMAGPVLAQTSAGMNGMGSAGPNISGAGTGMSSPNAGHSGTVAPLAGSGMANPGMTNPGMTNPGMANPGTGIAAGTGVTAPVTGVPVGGSTSSGMPLSAALPGTPR